MSLITLPFLSGCVDHRGFSDCSWVQPITLQDDTVQFLMEHEPWPPGLLEDLNKIDKHNRKCKEILQR